MTSEAWIRISDLWNRVWIGLLLWPADYPITGPIAIGCIVLYFVLRRKEHPHPERMAIGAWFVFMFLWWLLRFNFALYPFKLDGVGVRR